MKILLASSSPTTIEKINYKFKDLVEIVIVETGEEIFETLMEESFDCLITEFSLVDIDAWRLSIFIKNNFNHKESQNLPYFVIDDKSNYPSLLKYNYNLQTINLNEIPDIYFLIDNYKKINNKPKILVVEDDLLIAKGMKLTLKDNFDVDICHNKDDAVKYWNNKKHDLILLDLMLPGGSGEEVLSEIKLIDSSQEVVIVSASAEIEMQEKYMLLGVSDYLTKPFKPADLVRVCRVVLTQSILKHEVNRREKELNSLSETLFKVINTLEEGDTEAAINSLDILSTTINLNYRKGDDFYLKEILFS